jgi:hypothetical protein
MKNKESYFLIDGVRISRDDYFECILLASLPEDVWERLKRYALAVGGDRKTIVQEIAKWN